MTRLRVIELLPLHGYYKTQSKQTDTLYQTLKLALHMSAQLHIRIRNNC